jgi:hypothetical protein
VTLSVTEPPAATAFVHRAESSAPRAVFLLGLNYTLQLTHFSGILAERRHREKFQTDGSIS